MPSLLDQTHDPALRSWVVSAQAPDSDFPIQNLPHGVFRMANSAESWRGGHVHISFGECGATVLAARPL